MQKLEEIIGQQCYGAWLKSFSVHRTVSKYLRLSFRLPTGGSGIQCSL